ncbi:DUF389 domain-containing protein [Mycobacterium marinum]|uniref:Conserved hypothetical membrane protein n=1 Tax=Mycobacterium marinum (strain ATCC BAA-535 / M) TaxID=216594 RepID=B2HF52_MYCMM|nr:DUF389 domain-containing protein [Mycobacterium marinum]ACC41470.1 conserved hypothetical membrane protein [Mycobacterium marinum M]GJO53876.1 hypothetical protein NJB1604_44610 [Mycobacterium marinum]
MTVELPPKPMLTEIPGRSAVGESDDRATTDPTDPKGRAVPWRPKLLPVEDRRSIMDTLMVTLSGGALWRFAALMFLSSMVASIGLLQNSAAVVIGAMMIAPLMAPIMGIAACLIMGWGHRLLRGLALVAVSAMVAVGVGWITATLLPATGTGLPSEVVARSSPDIRDLLVAMGAGAVGALATVHKKISAALPGVAVAVAVVPPLGAAGVLLGRGQPQLARGAVILFSTNLVGIVVMAAVVFLLSGLVPLRKFRTHRRQIVASLGLAAVSAVAVAMILTPRFIALTGHARDLEIATQTLTDMLSPGSVLSHITATGSTVRADITSPTSPPPVQTVAASLSRALGHPVTVELSWIPVRDPEHSRPDTPQPPLNELGPVIRSWLGAQSLTLQGLSYESGTLVVSTAGPFPPKRAEELTSLIDSRFNYRIPVSLAWTRTSGPAKSDGTQAALDTARTTATAWAAKRPDVAVLSTNGTASAITITLIGQTQPEVDSLEADLQTALPQSTITIQWISGGVLVVATPTPEPTPAPAPEPEPTPAKVSASTR